MANLEQTFAEFDQGAPGSRHFGRRWIFALVSTAAMVTVAALSNLDGHILMYLAGCAGALLLVLGLVHTARHRELLIIAVLFTEMLTSTLLVPSEASTAARYGLNFILCAPLLPVIWRSEMAWKGGFRLLLFYFTWCLVTVTYSLAPAYSLGRLLISMLLAAALCVVAFDVQDKDDVARLLRNYVVGCGIILVILTVAAVVLPSGLTHTSSEMIDANGNPIRGTIDYASGGIPRFIGIFGNPNEVGALTIVTIGAALAYWSAASKRIRFLLAGMIALSAAFGIAADSRSAVAAAAIGWFAFAVWRYRWRGLLLFAVGGVLLTVAISVTTGHLSDYVARGDVTTLTGRTDIWHYAIQRVEERPLFGYGYEVEGEIYQSKYFPIWWGPWDEGPRSSLHDLYLSHLIGIGIPATLLWLYIMLRPWVMLARRDEDPWGLKPIGLLIVLPMLILGLSESSAGDCHYATGVLFVLCWAIAERERLIDAPRVANEQETQLNPTSPSAIAFPRVR